MTDLSVQNPKIVTVWPVILYRNLEVLRLALEYERPGFGKVFPMPSGSLTTSVKWDDHDVESHRST